MSGISPCGRNTDRLPEATGREIGKANFTVNSAPFIPACIGGAPWRDVEEYPSRMPSVWVHRLALLCSSTSAYDDYGAA
jgi:hypothetical protein